MMQDPKYIFVNDSYSGELILLTIIRLGVTALFPLR